LGTFWLKIEQFWPFEEISIFSYSGHLEWRSEIPDIHLEGDPFQICVRGSRLPTKMVAKLKIEKRGMKFKKNLL
jgi:hypothetical protein